MQKTNISPIVQRLIDSKAKPRVEWRCYSCGRTFPSNKSLKAHLTHCYWYQHEFKTHIEDAPFYKVMISRQLRYYRRNKAAINARRRKYGVNRKVKV